MNVDILENASKCNLSSSKSFKEVRIGKICDKENLVVYSKNWCILKNDNLVAPINLKSDFSSTESEDEDDVPIWKNGSEKLRIKKTY